MRKVFHFETPKENYQYQADAAVLWCFDKRFDLVFRKFLKSIGVGQADSIQLAGGAKSLASPDAESDREFVVEQVRKSMRLHGTRRVILTVHSDCGGYGGLAAFGNDVAVEAAHHEKELQRAVAHLCRAIPGLEVQGYLLGFEGIWQVEATGSRQDEDEAIA